MNKPLLLKPSGKNYIWGGRRLNDEFEKNLEMYPLAETWECSTHEEGASYIAQGEFEGQSLKDVLELHPDYLGKRHQRKKQLPILIKFIDANKDLSVQVHPDDEYAKNHEQGQLGKTEMWYVLDAAPNAKIIYGFRHDVDKKMIKNALEEDSLLMHLQKIDVKKGDVFFVEPGTVHAICAGTLIAEIQENSNLTYRLYDYNRKDILGITRELHIEKALDVVDMRSSSEPKQPLRVLKYEQGIASELLCRCKYFEVYRMIVNTERRQRVSYSSDVDGYRVLLCIGGCGVISFRNDNIYFFKGDCIFVPANSERMSILGQAQFLDVRG